MFQLKTAESVSPKHPDKICDQISDAILDAYLRQDSDARVAVDVSGGHGKVFITGEATSSIEGIDMVGIARRLAGDVEVIENVSTQSPEIAQGVDAGGAGDQGIMVGYATSETEEMLPREYVLARSLNQYLYGLWPYDGKTQVTLDGKKVRAVVASFQHAPSEELGEAVETWVRQQQEVFFDAETAYHINPSGAWHIGGFDADAGLTGRKLAVDNYGPAVPIGGGAFSGKDPSKVDRSAAYMARKIAVDYLRDRDASEVRVYLAYAIGYAHPLQATAIIDGRETLIRDYDLSPQGIVRTLDLKRPIYEQTARYGHFGHRGFTWES